MAEIKFFYQNDRLEFSIPDAQHFEQSVRSTIKKQNCKKGKGEYFFKRGIADAVKSCELGTRRKFGTPIVELSDPFSSEKMQMTCQEAKDFIASVGGLWHIEQVEGSPLPETYFDEFKFKKP